jgi:copper(I)-binding protein
VNRALRAATIGVLLLSPVALSACSAGQVTQTATQERDKTGAQAQVGDLTLRQGQLISPPGGVYESGDDAQLQLAIVNGGDQDDSLVSVKGEGFSSAVFSSSSASGSSASGSSASASGSSGASSSGAVPTTGSATPTTGSAAPTTSDSGTPTSSGSTSGASTSSASTSSAPAASGSGGGLQEIPIPAGESVYIGDQYTVTLTDLSKGLTPGQYLDITLTFQKAGDVTIPVSVANPTSGAPRTSSYDFQQEQGGAENAARSKESGGS